MSFTIYNLIVSSVIPIASACGIFTGVHDAKTDKPDAIGSYAVSFPRLTGREARHMIGYAAVASLPAVAVWGGIIGGSVGRGTGIGFKEVFSTVAPDLILAPLVAAACCTFGYLAGRKSHKTGYAVAHISSLVMGLGVEYLKFLGLHHFLG